MSAPARLRAIALPIALATTVALPAQAWAQVAGQGDSGPQAQARRQSETSSRTNQAGGPTGSDARPTYRIDPYIEVSQILTANTLDDDVLTFTQLSAGVDGSVVRKRVTATISARYDHNFSYSNRVGDSDYLNGLARVSAAVAPGVTVDGGAIATSLSDGVRGVAPGVSALNFRNRSQILSADIGPTVSRQAGDLSATASYRFGGTRVSNRVPTGLPEGARVIDNYSSSQRHSVVATAGTRPGGFGIPVGLSVTSAYELENTNTLDQRYQGYYTRADALMPVSPSLALVGGVGYEHIRISQRLPVIDATGNVVTDSRGRYVVDRSQPRSIAFDTTGLFWDAGVLYRPSPRSMAQLRVGRRYGSWSVTGNASWQVSTGVNASVSIYDGIQSFGRQLRGGVAGVPLVFVSPGDPSGQTFTGCTVGQSGADAGTCLTNIFQSVPSAQYRARGIDALVSAGREELRYGVGFGYSNRRFLVPDNGAELGVFDGMTDQNYYLQTFFSDRLTRDSRVDFTAYGNLFDSGLPGADRVYTIGMSAGYYRRIGNFGASAAVGLAGFDSDSIEARIEAQARVGLRYGF